ncbi:MAG: EAL domain-containing protein [Rhodoferax sp.]|nr:EAL domain-containing protein [Rhodoferax sp.]
MLARFNLMPIFQAFRPLASPMHVTAGRKNAHVDAMRRLGFFDYAITPDGLRESYAPVIQREPYVGPNQIGSGFDAWSDPVRRLAMAQARDSGMATISGKVRLTVDAEAEVSPGFIMYLPIYARGQPHDSVTQRREHLVGWVFSSFRIKDLMASLYGEQSPGLAFAIYDGVEPSDAALLYRTAETDPRHQQSALAANEYLVVAGHTWTLAMNAQDDFEARFGRDAATLIAVAGTGLSLLLALLAWLLATGRARALQLAAEMTLELRESEQRWKDIVGRDVNTIDDWEKLIHPNDQSQVMAAIQICFASRPGSSVTCIAEYRIRCGDDQWKWVLSRGMVVERNADDLPLRIIGTITDISDRKLAEEKIEELAFFDSLPHLPNRTLLMDRLKQAMTVGNRTGTCGAVLFIDLDHFKTLNDTLGHDKGDLLLQQVAQRLAVCVREGDTVARLGGDEFVVVLGSLDESAQEAATQTEVVGEKTLTSLSQIYRLGDIDHRSTASIGATLFCGHQSSIDDLLKQADLAMYKAKETGRNAVRFFDPAMQTAVIERSILESGLRRAIQENQLVLHYQAQVVGEGRVTGAEVLVRWQHPERGLVPPAEFIPLAEETGLILPLGHWVLESACSQLALWAGQPDLALLTVAVNVRVQQFRESGFVAKVLAVLSQTGANPNRLKLELTESLLVDNVEDIIEKMHLLKARGVGFSLDDFGTGYSSLSYLKQLPLDQLKIDQTFVRDVLVDPNDAAIAKTIVALAQSLGLGVIAEGVETQAQRDFLAKAGCYAYQGYFFSRPLPLDGFEEFARRAVAIN